MHGVTITIFPVKDLAGTKAFYKEMLGVDPYVDEPYYVGFRAGDQEFGLDPTGHRKGLTGPVGYIQVADIRQRLQQLLAAGGRIQQDVRDVGGGRLIATVADAEDNVIGLIQYE